MASRRAHPTLCYVALWFAVSCASGTREAQPLSVCTQVEACGGDLLGTWSLSDACYLSVKQPVVEGCELASTSAEVRDPVGQLSFDDTTYRFKFTLTMAVTVHLLEACLHQQDRTFACAELGGPIHQDSELVCSATPDGCDCKADLPVLADDTGSYSLRDSRLTLRSEPFDYCVQGDALRLNHRIDMDMGAGRNMITLLQLSLARQRMPSSSHD